MHLLKRPWKDAGILRQYPGPGYCIGRERQADFFKGRQKHAIDFQPFKNLQR